MLVSTERLGLKNLPSPPSGKSGWPWTSNIRKMPSYMPDGSPWPKVSIVTPSYNQGQFLEATIRSVLLQGYPNLEYIVIDGGSTDCSVEIIQKYSDFLTCWVSESDAGQANAINKGLKQVTGDYIGWINSDDIYVKSTFLKVVRAFRENPSSIVVHGNRILIDADGKVFGCSPLPPFNPEKTNFIVCSETAFWTNDAMHKFGTLDEDLEFAMDLEFFCRLYLEGSFTKLNDYLGFFRCHDASKSSTIWHVAEEESSRVWQEKFASEWPHQGVKRSRWKMLGEFLKHPALIGLPYLRTKYDASLKKMLDSSD